MPHAPCICPPARAQAALGRAMLQLEAEPSLWGSPATLPASPCCAPPFTGGCRAQHGGRAGGAVSGGAARSGARCWGSGLHGWCEEGMHCPACPLLLGGTQRGSHPGGCCRPPACCVGVPPSCPRYPACRCCPSVPTTLTVSGGSACTCLLACHGQHVLRPAAACHAEPATSPPPPLLLQCCTLSQQRQRAGRRAGWPHCWPPPKPSQPAC